jgi:FkbM family methyltransferase
VLSNTLGYNLKRLITVTNIVPQSIRKALKKWVYNSCPGYAGVFPYFGTMIYFPKNDCLFLKTCDEGIYEHDTLRALQSFAKPDTTIFDVGGNIGLLSASIVATCPSCSVNSFEPSPAVLPYLRKTVARSPHVARWKIFDCALSDKEGTASFSAPPASLSAFGGLKNTGRVAGGEVVEVRLRTLDNVWTETGKPQVSVLKIDTEGHELPVLLGAETCIASTRPAIVMEWNRVNLAASECDPTSLMRWADAHAYEVFTLMGGTPVLSGNAMTVMLSALNHENFILLPR